MAQAVAVAAVYFAAGKFGMSLAFTTKQVTAVWPPTGVAFVALLLLGYRAWPGVYLGAFLANLTANESLGTAAGIALGNTLAIVLSVWIVKRLSAEQPRLTRPRDVVAFVLGGAALACVVSATGGVANLVLGGIVPRAAFWSVWWVWWIGDALGVLLFAPFLLAWLAPAPRRLSNGQVAELLILLFLLSVLCHVVFAGRVVPAQYLARLEYTVFPLIIWAAVRFGQREATSVAVLISGFAIWGAIHDRGPYASGGLDQRLMLLDVFMGIVMTTALTLSAAVAQRREAERGLECARAQLEDRVRERTAQLAGTNAELVRGRSRLAEAQHIARLGSWDWDLKHGSLVWSDELFRIFGVDAASFAPSYAAFLDRVHPADRAQVAATIQSAREDHQPWSHLYRIVINDEVRWIESRGTVELQSEGEPANMLGTAQDVTEREEHIAEQQRAADERAKLNAQLQALNVSLQGSLREREVLLQEIHHRVKNNLQVISSLINMQSRKLDAGDDRDALEECRARVQAIALIHEKLYQSSDYARVPFAQYAESLASSVFQAHRRAATNVRLDLAIDDVTLGVDRAIPCGLILNELITNALKHGFPEGRSGVVRVRLEQVEAGQLGLTVANDGVVLPDGFEAASSKSLGLQLVRILAKQLGGRLDVQSRPGATFRLLFASSS